MRASGNLCCPEEITEGDENCGCLSLRFAPFFLDFIVEFVFLRVISGNWLLDFTVGFVFFRVEISLHSGPERRIAIENTGIGPYRKVFHRPLTFSRFANADGLHIFV